MERVSVFVKRPGRSLYHTNMSLSLQNLQNFVGGYIEAVNVGEYEGQQVVMICNEEGKLNGSLQSFSIVYRGKVIDLVFGDVVFIARDGEEFAGLTGKLQHFEEWLWMQGFMV